MSLSNLASEQQGAVYVPLEALQIAPSMDVAEFSPALHRRPVAVSSDPERSTIPQHHVATIGADRIHRLAGKGDLSLSNLTSEQQEAFYVRLKQLQIDPSKVVAEISPATHQGPVIISSDPERSTIPTHNLTILNVDEIKWLAGNADECFTSGKMSEHHDLPAIDPSEIEKADPGALGAEQNRTLDMAMRAYIYGNSARVLHWKNAIEKHRFPTTFTVYAVQNICINASNSPLLIESVSGGNIGTLKVCEGGWIKATANGNLTVQKMIRCDGSDCKSC
ncbi:hypothetical protein [Nisaea sp.]|uniref:hypothetical protein n=1 Tax=Nisaea sp. TaxID=2024842 RepID=UPI0032670543